MPKIPAAAMAQRLEMWPLDRLQPYERNARTHSAEQVAQIAASIQEFGFTSPILVDGDDGILAGHGRLMAAREMGLAEVPVVVLDHLTPVQRKAYILADNKLAMNAGWDEEMLRVEIAGLIDAAVDVSALGFDAEELSALWADSLGESSEDEEEEDEPPPRDGVPLAIVLTPQEMMRWREAKAEIGFSKDKTALLKLVDDLLEEVSNER
jgi:ParB-like chromosome segregation protein Spo0J